MNKKFLIATVSFIVLGFIFTALWHLVFFGSIYESLGIFTREQPIFALGILSFIFEGLAFVYLFQLTYKGKNPVKEGLIFGLLAFGVLMGSVGALAEGAKQDTTSLSTWLILESSFYLITGALLGMLVGKIYGRK